ncbi:MAG: potassium transporter TrkG [Pseudomonadota bacterium]
MVIGAIFYHSGWALLGLCALIAIPLTHALATGAAGAAWALAMTLSLCGFVGGAFLFSLRPRRGTQLDLARVRLAVVVIGWLTLSVCAGLPFYFSLAIPTFHGAIFEGASALTTTGSTALSSVSETPPPLLLWRALLQWVGGLATILTVAVLLAPARRNEDPKFGALQIGHLAREGAWLPRAAKTVIIPGYIALTAIAVFGLALGGLPWFDALCVGLAAAATGGMLPADGDFARYGSLLGTLVLGLVFALSAVSALWLRGLLTLQWRGLKDFIEPVWLFLILGLTALLIASSLLGRGQELPLTVIAWELALSFATAASLVSTAGMEITERTVLLIPFVLMVLLILIGGGRFSSAGGLKYFRVLAMLRHGMNELQHLIYPTSVKGLRSERGARDADVITVIWANFAFVIMLVFGFAMLVSLDNIDLPLALLMSVSALSNFGPGFIAAAAPNELVANPYAGLSPVVHYGLAIAMVLGRLEIIALLTLFNRAFWRF